MATVITGKQFLAFRPRLLYCPLFVWNTITVGKFIAPFLKTLSPRFSDSIIGVTFALQYGIVACFAGYGGSIADGAERRSSSWGWGRLQVLAMAVTIGSLSFLGHILPSYCIDEGIGNESNFRWDFELIWHVAMRCLYAASMAVAAPTIDGLSLAHLDRIEGASRADFGKERMWGAVFWGVGSLANGFGIDRFGYGFLYTMVILSTLATYVSIGLYIWGLEMDTSSAFSKNTEPQNAAQPPSNNRNESSIDTNETAHETPEISRKELLLMLCQTGYGTAFVFFVFVLAIGISVVDNLAFIFFEILGSSNTMNGLTVVFTVVCEVPCFYLAPYLLKLYGPGKLILFAGLTYVIRVFGYTLVPEGRMGLVLMLETLHGFTYACSKFSSVDFVANLIPSGYEASAQGILISVTYCGVVVGLATGGWIEETLGPRVMYGAMGTIVCLGMIVLVTASTLCAHEAEANTSINNERESLVKQTGSVANNESV